MSREDVFKVAMAISSIGMMLPDREYQKIKTYLDTIEDVIAEQVKKSE